MVLKRNELPASAPRRPDRRTFLDRLLGAGPLAWDEVEALLPSLNRREAARYLRGELEDLNQAALFDVLFAYHPSLREVLHPGKRVQEPPPVIVLRRQEPPIRAAAKQGGSGDAETFLSGADGYQVRVFAHPELGRTTLRFTGAKPLGEVTLYVNGSRIQLVEPFDQHGYGVVLTKDIAAVQSGDASLELTLGSQGNISGRRSAR
jgi:hypothetical protein